MADQHSTSFSPWPQASRTGAGWWRRGLVVYGLLFANSAAERSLFAVSRYLQLVARFGPDRGLSTKGQAAAGDGDEVAAEVV